MPKHTQPEYDALRQLFVEWILMPDRRPPTQRAFAELHDIAETTLSEWRRRPDVLAKLDAWRGPYRQGFVEVAHSLRRKAIGGGPSSVGAARQLTELLGLSEPRIADSTPRSLEELLRAAVAEPDANPIEDPAVLPRTN